MERTSSAAIGSSALVGSSRTKTLGCITRAAPIATRCCSPPLSVAIKRLRSGARLNRSRISSIRLRMMSGATLRVSILNASSSSTVSATKPCAGFWPTIPIKWARPPGLTVRVDKPSTLMSPPRIPPVWCGTKPLISRSSDDLPTPVLPITKTNSPSATEKERSSMTVFVAFG